MNDTMRTMRHIILITALAIGTLAARAQQEVMVSQYMFDQLFLNPAYAGSHPYVSGCILHREQWAGLPGAPRTSMLAVDGPVMGDKMGLGFSLVHDQIGISRDMEIAGDYSYSIRIGRKSRLAFGLKAGLSFYSAHLSELTVWDANDAVYAHDISNAVLGKFGFGMYWHNERSFIGVTVPTLYAADGRISTEVGSALKHYYVQHYYLHAGHVFQINDDFDVKPSVMIKYEPQAPAEADVNCNVLYKQRFWLGIGYRTGDAVVGMVEYQINHQMRIGYAYDMTTSKLRNYNSGSHEIMLGIDLGHDLIKIKSPRYF